MIDSCDGIDLTTKVLSDTIRPNRGSTNTLFHFTACLIGADSMGPGGPFGDLGFGFEINALISDMQSACLAGGSELQSLREACVAANSHDEITRFCPFDSTPDPFDF